MDRILQPSEYTFNAAAGTVAITLSSGGTVRLENLKLIINQTDNIIIFSSTNTAKQATLAGSTFTLEYDTTSMADGDALKIIYYDQDYVTPVSATALPLPSGAATAANQATLIAKDFATETSLAAVLAKIIAAPSTEAKQDAIIALLTTIDADTGAIAADFSTATLQTALNNLLTSVIEDNGTHDFVRVGGHYTGANYNIMHVDAQGDVQVDVLSSALPTGASTEANQTTIIGHVDGIETLLTSLDGKDFATQTTLAAVLSALQATIAISGSVTANAGTNLNTSALALESGGNLAGIRTSVETIDNAISGNEMQVDVVAALPAGTNTIGGVNVVPATSGGLSIFRSIDLDESEEEVKATAGQVFGWYLFNGASSTLYVKLYNGTAVSVVVGTTTPVITIPVSAGAAANVEFTNGIAFGTAITAACTTGVADSDTGAPGANELIMNLFYK